MTAIPECMTRRPAGDEVRAARRRLVDAGALGASWRTPVRVYATPGGGNSVSTDGPHNADAVTAFAIVLAAALLDATERAERAEAEVAALVRGIQAYADAERTLAFMEMAFAAAEENGQDNETLAGDLFEAQGAANAALHELKGAAARAEVKP